MRLRYIIILLFVPLNLIAQTPDWYMPISRKAHYPSELWYTGFAEGTQLKGETLENAHSRLTNAARIELASTIRTSVEHNVDNYTQSDLLQSTQDFEEYIRDVNTTITRISSNVKDIPGLKVEWYRNPSDGTLAAFAYVNKNDLIQFYTNQLQVAYTKINASITISDYLISREEFLQAHEELKQAQDVFNISEENYTWLLLFGCDSNIISAYQKQRTEIKRLLGDRMKAVSNTITVCVRCEGNFFETPCSKLTQKVKSEISKKSCSVIDTPENADWIVILTVSAELEAPRLGSDEEFVTVEVSGSAFSVKKKTSHAFFESERDSASKKNGGYTWAVQKILGRSELIDLLVNHIIEIIKSR